ncbi:MAG: serine hydrolase domain-containing protein [Brachymonas sp.]|nr:serine hydrolase domain-containing protein [Brachymonas sp.]
MQTFDAPKLATDLDQLAQSFSRCSDVHAPCFVLHCPSRNWQWRWPDAPTTQQPYFIASATKLYVTTLVMQLRHEGSLALDAPAHTYLPPGLMDGLHCMHGQDASKQITVRHLLAHTSGLADYFEQKQRDGKSQFEKALAQDFAWSLQDVLRITREEMQPHFAPGAPQRALYSDTNYQLLGAIVEALTHTPLEQAIAQRITSPLGLHDTWLFTQKTLNRYDSVARLHNGRQAIRIPLAMASVRADGGMVSTAQDGIGFLQAFIAGALFPASYLHDMQAQWNHIFRPLQYGVGIMRFALPWYFSPFAKVPEMIGHSGASGTVLFHVPELDLYVSGTINQIARRSLPYRLMTSMVLQCRKAWSGK